MSKDIQKAREAFDRSENWSEWVADHEAAIIKALDRAIQEQRGDYVLVPREPTDEMDDLGREAQLFEHGASDIYRAMIAAAQLQTPPDVVGDRCEWCNNIRGSIHCNVTPSCKPPEPSLEGPDQPTPKQPVEAGDEIKPCPFCGSDYVHVDSSRSMQHSGIRCGDCNANISGECPEETIKEAWNTRTQSGDGGGIDVLRDAIIINGGDGVNGHYCIGRKHADGYWEFYNKGKWLSAGQVFYEKEQPRPRVEDLEEALRLAQVSCETRHRESHYVRDFPYESMVKIRDVLEAYAEIMRGD